MRALPVSLVCVVSLFGATFAGAASAEDAPKADAPKADAPKADAADPKTDDAKPDAPKADDVKAAEVKPTEVKPDAAKPAVEEQKPTVKEEPKAVDCPKDTLLCWKSANVAVWPKLRVRPGFKYVDADSRILYIGQNDGFFLDQAKIGAEGNVSDVVHFKLTVDGASLLPGGAPNQTVTSLLAAASDAWVAWTPSQLFIIQAGQQLMPADFEGGDVDAIIPFTHKSVASGGVRNGEGNAVTGLSPGRQIGVVVGSADKLSFGDIPVEYRLGLSNGNGQNLLGNDNKLPAAYLRLGSGFGELVRVGVGGRFNPRTVGTLPNLYTESDMVGFADVALKVAGFAATAEGVARQTALSTLVPDATNPAGQESSTGGSLWLGYTVDMMKDMGFSVTPAYRISFYDPSSTFATDQLLENTLGVRIDGDPHRMPLSFMLDYTVLTELGDLGNNVQVRDLADNRLTALFQIEL